VLPVYGVVIVSVMWHVVGCVMLYNVLHGFALLITLESTSHVLRQVTVETGGGDGGGGGGGPGGGSGTVVVVEIIVEVVVTAGFTVIEAEPDPL
jgi:hypothetical protein